jgi:hypothetical protein
MMILHVRTNAHGSDCSTEIGLTESQWEKLSEEERDGAVREALGDVFESWVAPEGE